jgi:hypothetical protein
MNYPIQHFTLSYRTSNKDEKIIRFHVSSDTEKYVFTDMKQIKASLRDDRINEIFED